MDLSSSPARGALLGVLGHVDHGKTALVRALTGTETDRLPEEKARGISIALGFACLRAPCGAVLDLVDVPGHERFIRTMAAGATAMDATLLCVDAAEGVRPQTVEHAEIAALLGLTRGIVAVTRCDREAAEPARAAAQARALLARLGLGDWPVVETSAATGAGIAALAAALGDLAREAEPGRPGTAWLPVDRVFALPGAGTIATGTLRRGALAPGDALEVLPTRAEARIRGIQIHGLPALRALPGRRVAVALRGVALEALHPGDVLAAPGLLRVATRLDVRVTVLASAPRALASGDALRLHAGTAECGARLQVLGRAALEPGEAGVAQLHLDTLLALPARERVILRQPSPARTLAGALVLDPDPPRRRGRDAALLEAMAVADPAGAAAIRLRDAGARGCPRAALARLMGIPAAALDPAPLEAEPLPGAAGLLMHGPVLDSLSAASMARVEALLRADPTGPGPAPEALRAALPAGAPVAGLVARLVAEGKLALASGRLRLRGVEAAALLSEADRALVAAVEADFRHGGLCPPNAAAVVGSDRRRAQALHLLLRQGRLVRAPDAVQKREVIFHAEALDLARRTLAAAFAARAEGFLAGECARLLGISRRFAIPLLERLDAERFTQRAGDRRRVAG